MPLRVFPVQPESAATYEDTFGAPRSGGRTHAGTDIFADEGTPLVAVDDGSVFFGTGELGGNVARLEAGDARYIYSHLVDFEGEERAVRAGDVIGYVGRTGNAAQTPPHVHFEIHPGGGAAVNPFPLLQEVRGAVVLPPGALPEDAATPGEPLPDDALPEVATRPRRKGGALVLLGVAAVVGLVLIRRR